MVKLSPTHVSQWIHGLSITICVRKSQTWVDDGRGKIVHACMVFKLWHTRVSKTICHVQLEHAHTNKYVQLTCALRNHTWLGKFTWYTCTLKVEWAPQTHVCRQTKQIKVACAFNGTPTISFFMCNCVCTTKPQTCTVKFKLCVLVWHWIADIWNKWYIHTATPKQIHQNETTTTTTYHVIAS